MHRYTHGPNANVVKQSTEENLLKSAKFGSTRKVEIGKMIERRKPDLCGVVILGNLAEKMKMELSCLRQLRQLDLAGVRVVVVHYDAGPNVVGYGVFATRQVPGKKV